MGMVIVARATVDMDAEPQLLILKHELTDADGIHMPHLEHQDYQALGIPIDSGGAAEELPEARLRRHLNRTVLASCLSAFHWVA